jgi:hypothetical protein
MQPAPPWLTELERLRREQNPARYGDKTQQPTVQIPVPLDEPPEGWEPDEPTPEPADTSRVIVIQL